MVCVDQPSPTLWTWAEPSVSRLWETGHQLDGPGPPPGTRWPHHTAVLGLRTCLLTHQEHRREPHVVTKQGPCSGTDRCVVSSFPEEFNTHHCLLTRDGGPEAHGSHERVGLRAQEGMQLPQVRPRPPVSQRLLARLPPRVEHHTRVSAWDVEEHTLPLRETDKAVHAGSVLPEAAPPPAGRPRPPPPGPLTCVRPVL